MLKIYGSMLCGDCAACCEVLDQANISYEFLDFADELQNLKDFLKLRDENSLFDDARKVGAIGIPCILREDGTMTLDWKEFLHM